jgi:hypothetical protein
LIKLRLWVRKVGFLVAIQTKKTNSSIDQTNLFAPL